MYMYSRYSIFNSSQPPVAVHTILKGSPSSPGSSSIGSNSSTTSSNISSSSSNSLPASHTSLPPPPLSTYSPSTTEVDVSRLERVSFGSCSSVPIPIPMQTALMAHTEASSSPSLDINELLTNVSSSGAQILHNTNGRSFLLAPTTVGPDDSNGAYINWLYDLYAPNTGGSPGMSHKHEKVRATLSSTSGGSMIQVGTPPTPQSISVSPDIGVMIPTKTEDSPPSCGGPVLSSSAPASTDGATLMSKEIEFHKEPLAVFRAQERYLIILGAPTSIAQRQGEDTLTYLNKGQFYSIYFRANNEMVLPSQAKSVIHLSFLDESDRTVEQSHWQYWYELQANPNQKAFDIDRKNCEGLIEKPLDLGYNAASFIWDPRLGARVVLRINCLSTEFSGQKGVKGLPLHVVVDTYEFQDNDRMTEHDEPSHRAYCRVKIFRDKGAERKNKDETKSVERRLQKFIRSYNSVNLDSEIGPATVFHPPCKETTLTPTSTFGPKPFLFKVSDMRGGASHPQEGAVLSSNSAKSSSTFLENIKEREMKRSFTRTLTQTKEDLDQLEVGPRNKSKRINTQPMTTIYVRKEEEKVYNALSLRELTVEELKHQISNKYDIPDEMIHFIYKKTKKGLIVRFDDELVTRFEDEDDFIIDLDFDNQKGHFDLYIRY
ncbi:PREDICTED: grainyhead-like protein 2 homolog isoform X2 [Amphimedon queenslandica]|uniref:Grh/CP2 DB domain-containing protein n=1 Tax=Amphimedon queenslandica TaxID=400682 RepID=A0AAN0JM69_AMPQE|nr:PREDICTED: grainyhead-like protein 2 homolog isoform X2 [Amphimedon queenslandica]|eukprot:XP_019858101.1 PREDICTED: grainyhead-like protein 2 homolog isoform X2 [Amphimedon queenslandica]